MWGFRIRLNIYYNTRNNVTSLLQVRDTGLDPAGGLPAGQKEAVVLSPAVLQVIIRAELVNVAATSHRLLETWPPPIATREEVHS